VCHAKLTFALNNWTAEQRGDYWYYGDTYREGPRDFRGPYSSIASVTLMIAREDDKGDHPAPAAPGG